MARSTKAKQVSEWVGRIKRAIKLRDEADRKYGYTRAQLMYENNFREAMPSFMHDVDLVPINEVYAFVKAFVPSIYSRDPHIALNPKGAKHIASAKLLQLAVNGYWRELRLKKEIRRVILDAILAEGWMKVGYTATFGKLETKEDEPDLDPSEFVRSEELFATRISWRDMVRDPDSTKGLDDARWVAHRIITPLEAVQAAGIYDHAAQLKPMIITSDSDDPRLEKIVRARSRESGQEREWAELWEIWDRDTNQVLTLSEGFPDDFLKEDDWPLDIEGFPFALLRFNEAPDRTYSPNMIEPWIAQLWEKIKLRSMQLDHIKRFNRQLSVEEGAMTDIEIQKMQIGHTGMVTKRKKGTLPPAPITYPQIQPDIYAVEARIDLDKDNVSGQPNAVRSAPQKTQSRTLGEIDRLISSFNARQSEPQSTLEDFVSDVALKLIGLMKQFLPGEKFVRATQREVQEIIEAFGPDRFDGTGFNFTRADIADTEFELTVKVGSTLPLNRENRIATAIEILKLGPTIGIQPGGPVSIVIGKNLLADLEQKEIEVAFDQEIARTRARDQLQRQAAIEKVKGQRRQIEGMREDLQNGGQPGGV